MSYQVLARKWRPKTFQELVGQESVVQALANGLDNDRVHHAFILTGTRGVGKTTLARILAKCLNCEQGVSSTPCGTCASCVDIDEGRFQDMLEIDAASRTGVDDTRELLETVQFAPTRGRFKVYIIDEVHMLTVQSFNALLKTLEEPPPHVKFVLATTDPHKIPVTIQSRCLRFNLQRLLPEQIGGHLTRLVETENIDAEPAAIERIARAADGSMRDGLSLLDQAIAFGGGRLEDEDVAQMMGSVDHEHVVRLVEALASTDAEALLEIVRDLAAQSRKLDLVLDALAEALHRIGLVQLAPGYRDPERSDWESLESLAESLSPEDVQLYYQIAIQGKRDLGLAPDPRTGLEMTLLRMLAFRPAGAAAAPVPAGGKADRSASSPPSSPARPKAKAVKASAKESAAAPVATPAEPLDRGGEAPDWHRVYDALELAGPVRELARNLHLDSCRDGRWRFHIPEDLKYLGSDALVQQLQSAMRAQLGQAVEVAVKPVRQVVASPAAASEAMDLRQRSDAEIAIDQDPTVRALKERFGARIDEDSIQPLQ
ncbi:MAG: DNA polymerase III subunit gamma/tau [Xanthomonadales bacterium]|jgi:DNA polymerase-3 subunit gamma/tau|nr:DNA polymerase III subunit gamma/tau [Xanthomonadales bacterium]